MRNRIYLLVLALLGIVGAPDPTAGAAPSKPTIRPPAKPHASRVFVKEGAPAIKLVDGLEMQPLFPKPPPGPGDAGWTAPVVEPFKGKLVFSARTSAVGSAGLHVNHGRIAAFDQHLLPAGIYFDADGSIGIGMPSTAIGGSDLLMTCVGDLPAKVSVYAHTSKAGGVTGWMRLMDLSIDGHKAKFVVVPGELPDDMIFEVGLFVEHATQSWRVDKCTIKRIAP